MRESWSPSVKDAVRGGTVNNPEPPSRVPCLAGGSGREEVEQTQVCDLILHNLGGRCCPHYTEEQTDS